MIKRTLVMLVAAVYLLAMGLTIDDRATPARAQVGCPLTATPAPTSVILTSTPEPGITSLPYPTSTITRTPTITPTNGPELGFPTPRPTTGRR